MFYMNIRGFNSNSLQINASWHTSKHNMSYSLTLRSRIGHHPTFFLRSSMWTKIILQGNPEFALQNIICPSIYSLFFVSFGGCQSLRTFPNQYQTEMFRFVTSTFLFRSCLKKSFLFFLSKICFLSLIFLHTFLRVGDRTARVFGFEIPSPPHSFSLLAEEFYFSQTRGNLWGRDKGEKS